ncbi:MAG: glycosyltransferase [Chlorobiaceae bacterium]
MAFFITAMMLLYQTFVALTLLVFLGIVLANLRALKAIPPDAPREGALASVLVPARNEELNIERCLRSLLRQDYHAFEILVLDDSSTDATPRILQRLSAEFPGRLTTLQGEPLAEGWHGKAWACSQLARRAAGEFLLFTDADTMHEPDALRRALGALAKSESDMLSLTPRQELGSFWEKLAVPLIYFIFMSFLPVRLVSKSSNPAFSFANGQFILFTRDIYKRIGGHAAVREAIVEDVWLCMAVKKAGGRVSAFEGSAIVSCRMYRTLGEIWEGFSKNLFAGLGYSTPLLVLLMAVLSAVYIAPYCFFLYALVSGEHSPALFWLPLLHIGLAFFSRVLIARFFGQPLAFVFLHSLSQLLLLGIAANSFYMMKSGRGSLWKGRSYNFS